MSQKFTLIALFVLLGGLSACQKYSVSINDKVIYTPAPIFKDYQIADEKLRNCVAQTLQDLNATRAQDLTQLNCSNAGIQSLTGLEKFYALKALNLSDNQITSINTLAKLGLLEQLLLSNNKLEDGAALLHLVHLQQLDLSGNPQLKCADLKQLEENLRPLHAQVELPQHCKG